LRGVVAAGSAVGEGGALKALGGHPLTHPLCKTFYTQTPFRYGEHIAKLSVAPVAAKLTALKDITVIRQPTGTKPAPDRRMMVCRSAHGMASRRTDRLARQSRP
jgi:hypothetical protein